VNFARFRVAKGHLAFEDIEQFVGREDRPKILRMAVSAAHRQPEYQLVNVLAGDINPVRYLTRGGVAPQMTGHGGVGDSGRLFKSWSWGRAVFTHLSPLGVQASCLN
jgi:hypothetical protein